MRYYEENHRKNNPKNDPEDGGALNTVTQYWKKELAHVCAIANITGMIARYTPGNKRIGRRMGREGEGKRSRQDEQDADEDCAQNTKEKGTNQEIVDE